MNKLWKTADDAVFTQFVGDFEALVGWRQAFLTQILLPNAKSAPSGPKKALLGLFRG